MVILDKKQNRNDRLRNGSSTAAVNEDKKAKEVEMLSLQLTEESQLQKSVSLFNQLELKNTTSLYFCS